MELAELTREKPEDILHIAAQHGAFNVRVFGSVARGEASSDSDIDFLVDVGPGHSSWFPGGLIVDLETLLERRVDTAEPETLHWFTRDQVMSEARPL